MAPAWSERRARDARHRFLSPDPSGNSVTRAKTVLSCLATTERIMALAALLGQKRQDVLRIAGKYGARRVRIFGSVARGEADSQSDIDFLVDLDPGRSLFDLGGLQFELEALLGCPVDVVTERGLKPRIRERVLREAVPV